MALIVAAATTGGCGTTGDTNDGGSVSSGRSSSPGASTPTSDASSAANLTPAERRMREQSQAFQRTVWEGALIGAGAGAIWGLIQRDDAKDIFKKALIGGAVGGLAGSYIAHVQKQYATKEEQLDAMIADVRSSNQETEALIVSVRQVIAEDRRRLASVQQRYQVGQATEADLASVRQRIKENQAVVNQAAEGAREQYGMFEDAERKFRKQNPDTDTGSLQRELDAYNQQIDTLDGLADSISVA
ncbi:MAG: hypothetical protein K9L88_17000 [Chromatiaceae bacterium]|nr:hypothetical protein [Chromatiaceae bacterium]